MRGGFSVFSTGETQSRALPVDFMFPLTSDFHFVIRHSSFALPRQRSRCEQIRWVPTQNIFDLGSSLFRVSCELHIMTKKTLLPVAIIAMSFIFPAAIRAQSFNIEIGDRGYYTHGATYWDNDWEMTWAPGHWSEHGHHWIHGHYVRGQHRHHRDRHDDRHNDRHDDHDH